MDRVIKIKIWVLLLCLLFGVLFLIVYGWSIKSTLAGSAISGSFGKTSLLIASFPSQVKSVFATLREDTLEKDEAVRIPTLDVDLSQFENVHNSTNLNVSNLKFRASSNYLEMASHWRILVGVFAIDGEIKNAAIVLDPNMHVVMTWLLHEEDLTGVEVRAPHRKIVHGFDLLNDGSVIFAFDGGETLQRFNICGGREWFIPGKYHHSVTVDHTQEFVWTLIGDELAKIRTEDGVIDQKISMDDIILANPTLDILQIRQKDVNGIGTNKKNTSEDWLGNPADWFHLNDVDPLPEFLADKFSDYETGDLLVSARSLNLVFIVDPDTHKIKWWRFGATRRQHDPDWGWDGSITVFDNRMSRDYSRIISIEPGTYQVKNLYGGKSIEFYSRIRGKYQVTESGHLIVASTQEGRVFEVDPDGEVGLEIINMKPGDTDLSYVISQAIILPNSATRVFGEKSC